MILVFCSWHCSRLL